MRHSPLSSSPLQCFPHTHYGLCLEILVVNYQTGIKYQTSGVLPAPFAVVGAGHGDWSTGLMFSEHVLYC